MASKVKHSQATLAAESDQNYHPGVEVIDAIFVDGGVAHYHIVYDDGDEEEVYRDEAIALLLAANGFD